MSSPNTAIPNAGAIREARARIAPYVRRTPVLADPELDRLLGLRVSFKCENLQLGGAFKLRGAMNAVLSLVAAGDRRALLTQSSGNHGAALARACRLLGRPVTVVVPRSAPPPKLELLREQGARLVFCEPEQASRDAAVAALRAEADYAYVHPFDDPRVIAGQGTAALEWLEEEPALETILVPVSGGGLASGIAIAAHAHDPRLAVIGVEPAGAADALASLRAGRIVRGQPVATLCDALRAELGELTFAILSRHLEEILVVEDEDALAAMAFAWQRLKLVLEPSGAVALAALLAHRERLRGRRVGVLLSGGNVDPGLFAQALARPLPPPGAPSSGG
ncbi:MAG: threonine/serine dehydratase [Xanthomonadales bacterium]|nr:threonine/serine dehydratase [Xanthomonadales bacterium]